MMDMSTGTMIVFVAILFILLIGLGIYDDLREHLQNRR